MTTTNKMTREFVENIESKLNVQFGYFLRCDDIHKPSQIETDMYFLLWEEESLINALQICEDYQLNYDWGFQEFDIETENIKETCFVVNNYLNY